MARFGAYPAIHPEWRMLTPATCHFGTILGQFQRFHPRN
jgi:hypothetical protein